MADPEAERTTSGILVIDKPGGMTSHDVVARARKALRTRQVGHAGTLDPMATGVLVVAIGEATKLVPWLTADDKAYLATLRLGIATDTLDRDGRETARAPVPEAIRRAGGPTDPVFVAALAAERARGEQVPPAYSAIRIGGERAHDLARAGRLEASLPARPVAVRSLELLALRSHADAEVELDLRVEAAKGYFVRSLAHDLAAGLGTVGHLTALRRLRSGAFTIDEAVTLDAIVPARLLAIADAAARSLPVTVLDDAGVRAASFGQRVDPAQMSEAHAGPSAWLDGARRLVAIGERDADGTGRVLRGFSGA